MHTSLGDISAGHGPHQKKILLLGHRYNTITWEELALHTDLCLIHGTHTTCEASSVIPECRAKFKP